MLLIVVIINQPSTVAAISWASLPGAGYGQFEHRADAWLQNSKPGGTVRDWCMSRVTAIISALVICIIVCLSWAVNHYRINRTYKARRDKNARELKHSERGNYWHADASAWCCCLDAKYTRKELADAKAENDALRDDVAALVVWLHIKAVCQSVVIPPPPAWMSQPPPTGRHRWTARIISPSERGPKSMQKQLERASILMGSADESCYRWATHTIIVRLNTHALPAL